MKTCIKILGVMALVLLIAFLLYLGAQDKNLNENVSTSVSAIEIFELENETRMQEEIPPLELNEVLTAAAQAKAEYMAARSYFAHTSPEGVPFWYWVVKYGYNYLYTGENLAVKFKTSEGVFNAWMKSDSHKKNILDSGFAETGIGIASGVYKGVQTEFVVQLFGFEMPSFE